MRKSKSKSMRLPVSISTQMVCVVIVVRACNGCPYQLCDDVAQRRKHCAFVESFTTNMAMRPCTIIVSGGRISSNESDG